jgi:hypothetical protein
MSLLTEAGIFGYLAVITFAAAVFSLIRSKDPLRVAPSWAAGVAGLGMIGVGLGQRLVDAYLDRVPDLAEKVVVLSAGTREASANLLLGGICAVGLLAFGAVLSASRRE